MSMICNKNSTAKLSLICCQRRFFFFFDNKDRELPEKFNTNCMITVILFMIILLTNDTWIFIINYTIRLSCR